MDTRRLKLLGSARDVNFDFKTSVQEQSALSPDEFSAIHPKGRCFGSYQSKVPRLLSVLRRAASAGRNTVSAQDGTIVSVAVGGGASLVVGGGAVLAGWLLRAEL